MLTNSKIVVTGGCGFIGSHLVDALIAAGNHVIVIDDLSTGRLENIEQHIKVRRSTFDVQSSKNPHLVPSPSMGEGESLPRTRYGGEGESKTSHVTRHTSNFSFIQGGITDLPLLQNLFRGVDYVFHEAAVPSVPRSVADPVTSHEVNSTGTLNVLLAARDNKVKKVIYAASSSAYGDTPTLPKREDMVPHPLSPYAVAKLTSEFYCSVFTAVYGLPTVCLRYFNVYGPRQDPESEYAAVIPKFIKLVRGGQPPVIYGDGEQTRDFTFIKDIVAANLLFAANDAAGVFNIGSSERITLNALAEIIISQLTTHNPSGEGEIQSSKNPPNLVPSPLMGEGEGEGESKTSHVTRHTPHLSPAHTAPRPGDIKHSLADITKAKACGYNPEYNIEKGLKEMLNIEKERTY